MGNGIIDMRETEIDNVQIALNKSISNIDSFTSNFSPSFKDATDVGLLSRSTSTIQDQMTTINDQIIEMNKSVSNMYSNMDSLEINLASKANDIQSPTEFNTNDTASAFSTDEVELDKEDGLAIKKNHDNYESDLDFKTSLEYNEKLKNIVKEYEYEYGEIEIQGNLINLQNIKKDQVGIDSTTNEYTIEEEMLSDINKKIKEELPEIDKNVDIKFVELKSIKNQNVEIEDVDLLYLNIRKVILKKLNNGNYILKKL